MVQTITATYAQDKDDWTVTVAGLDRKLSGKAPGIIAARDRADQLVEKLAPEGTRRPTVVHLLNGSALEFTSTYIAARLAKTDATDATETTAGTEQAQVKDGAASGGKDGTEPAPAPKQAVPAERQPAATRAPAGRAVPRKELSKTPSERTNTAAAQARPSSMVAAGSGAPTGSTTATG